MVCKNGNSGEAAKEYASGFAAGIATVITGYPFDTVKVKLQAHNTKGEMKAYRNAWHCTTQLLANEGVKGFYRGASSSFVGMAFESSVLFGVYSQMRQLLQGGEPQYNKPHLQAIMPSAAFCGTLISFILCPTELVKCRMQVQGIDPVSSNYVKYAGPLDCALKTVKNEGIRGIFRGGFATFLRESIGNVVFFSTYEFTRYFMRSHLNGSLYMINWQEKLLMDVGVGIFSGGLAGMAFWAVVLPLDVAKTIIQTSHTKSSSRNPFLTINLIYRRVGLRGCYAGLGPTLVRAFPANAAAIVAWEISAKLMGLRHVKEPEEVQCKQLH